MEFPIFSCDPVISIYTEKDVVISYKFTARDNRHLCGVPPDFLGGAYPRNSEGDLKRRVKELCVKKKFGGESIGEGGATESQKWYQKVCETAVHLKCEVRVP